MDRIAAALFAATLLATVAAPTEGDGSAPAPASQADAVHPDAAATEIAMLDAYRAVLRDDVEALHRALRALDGTCRVLAPDGPARLEPLRAIDRGYHATYDAAVEAAAAGDLSGAVEQHYWMTVGCRRCHVIARKEGLLPNRPLMRGGPDGDQVPQSRGYRKSQPTERGDTLAITGSARLN